jgi:hypothetical protein
MDAKRPTFGLDTFWETCDRDGIAEDPLFRELCYRSDILVHYRTQILAAEELGDDEAVAVLSRHYDDTRDMIRRLREAIQQQNEGKASLPAT